MYSTVNEFKSNTKLLTTQNGLSDSQIIWFIEQADNVVNIDLSRIIPKDKLSIITPVPDIVNKLSQYKSVEIALRANMFGGYMPNDDEDKDKESVDWLSKYNSLLKDVLDGNIRVEWEGAYQTLAQTEAQFDFPSVIKELDAV